MVMFAGGEEMMEGGCLVSFFGLLMLLLDIVVLFVYFSCNPLVDLSLTALVLVSLKSEGEEEEEEEEVFAGMEPLSWT